MVALAAEHNMDEHEGEHAAPARHKHGGGHHDDEHEEHPHEEGEPWLMSFADLILNLLLFFIVLYSISNVDQKKFQELAQAINGEQVPQTVVGKAEDVDENGEILQEIQTLMQKVNQEIATDAQKKKAAEVQSKLGEMFRTAPGKDKENDLFEVILGGEKYFAKGSAAILPQTRAAIRAFAEKMISLQGDVGLYIEGHAAPSEFGAEGGKGREWQLASERASNVLLELQNAGVKVKDVSTAGFGSRVDISAAAKNESSIASSAETQKALALARARVHIRVVREVKNP